MLPSFVHSSSSTPKTWRRTPSTASFLVGRALPGGASITRPGIEHRRGVRACGARLGELVDRREQCVGPAHVLAHAPIARPAVYGRASTSSCRCGPRCRTWTSVTRSLTLVLHVDEGADEATLYEDAGDGWDHERGVFARRPASGARATAIASSSTSDPARAPSIPGRQRVVVELRGLRDGVWRVRVQADRLERRSRRVASSASRSTNNRRRSGSRSSDSRSLEPVPKAALRFVEEFVNPYLEDGTRLLSIWAGAPMVACVRRTTRCAGSPRTAA